MTAARTTISIPENNAVLVVEDNQERLEWFRNTFKGMRYASCESTEQALMFLEHSRTVDRYWTPNVVFLDHDAVPRFVDPADPDHDTKTFFRVAQQLVKDSFDGLVIVHSGNPVGAKRIADLLSDQSDAHVVIAPFGSFKIVRSCVRD